MASSNRAEEEEYWPTFKKKAKVRFRFRARVGPYDRNGIAEFVTIQLGVGGDNLKKMSVRKLSEAESKTIVEPTRFHFTPFFVFRRGGLNLGVGRYVGVNVADWLSYQSKPNKDLQDNLWVRNSPLGIVGATPQLSALLKRIALALLEKHQIHKPLGFNMSTLYINGLSTFKLLGDYGVGDPMEGIWNDLQQFKRFVNYISLTNPNADSSIALFNALFPTNRPNTINELVVRSYIICHSPLFWTIDQRVRFANVYNDIRDSYDRFPNPNPFDREMTCNSGIYDLSYWSRQVDKSLVIRGDVLEDAYLVDRMRQPHLLLQYIRNCFNHQSGPQQPTVVSLDQMVLLLFPFGYSKTYGQLVDKLFNSPTFPFGGQEFVDMLKAGGLNYTKDVEIQFSFEP